MGHIVRSVEEGSIGQEMGIEPGDVILTINDQNIADVFDYRYHVKDEYLKILVQKPDGEEWLLEIEKDEDEDMGLGFDTGLMDRANQCCNNCIFCFIDQLPSNMRESLNFYDDDARLSFLTGNYVTLTNMNKEELDRIIFYHLSPINISVHTTDLRLRRFVLGNPDAPDILEQISSLQAAGIAMNYQIVLCKDINDKENLDKTIEDLSRFIPQAVSLSVVPVGLTAYREGLHQLSAFTKEDAVTILQQVSYWQEKLLRIYGTPFVYAADEFYLKAETEFPPYENYGDFPQLENGVGMAALFKRELEEALDGTSCSASRKSFSIVTGRAAGALMLEAMSLLADKYPYVKIRVHIIENHFFGENITVSGLLTGQDILEQLKNVVLYETILIPANALCTGTEMFLDNMTVGHLQEVLQREVIPLVSIGEDFIKLLS